MLSLDATLTLPRRYLDASLDEASIDLDTPIPIPGLRFAGERVGLVSEGPAAVEDGCDVHERDLCQ